MKKLFLGVCLIFLALANIVMADEFVEELKIAKLYHNDGRITILYHLEEGHYFSRYDGLYKPIVLKPKDKIVFITRPAYSKKKYPNGSMWINISPIPPQHSQLDSLIQSLEFKMIELQPHIYTSTMYAVSLSDFSIPGAKRKVRFNRYTGKNFVEQWHDPMPVLSAVFRVRDIGKTSHIIEVENTSNNSIKFHADITIAPYISWQNYHSMENIKKTR